MIAKIGLYHTCTLLGVDFAQDQDIRFNQGDVSGFAGRTTHGLGAVAHTV